MRGAAMTILAAVSLTACDNGQHPVAPLSELPRELSAVEQRLIAAGNAFAFPLLRATIDRDPTPTNHFLSPLSVSVALGMTLNGAAGTTAEAMRTMLGFADLGQGDVNAGYRALIDLLAGLDPSVTWSLANSVWYRDTYTFRQSFFHTTRAYFDADVRPLDFGAASAGPTINAWVSDRTRGRITEIVPEQLPFDAIMFLINAIYFKGDWTTSFNAQQTRNAAFRLPSGAAVEVPMMSGAMRLRIVRSGGLTVVELPYARQAFAMTIVVPPGNASVDSVARSLTQQQWDQWIAGLREDSLPVRMPKFTVAYELKPLKDVLTSLGMGVAFCDSERFDFSNMDPLAQACISSVRHRTFIQVDEVGTEAAAVTSVRIDITSAGGPTPVVIDRPFLFAIRERISGTILFMGVVRNPAA